MSVYDLYGNAVSAYNIHNIIGKTSQAHDIDGHMLGDYNIYSSEYERNILQARDAWIAEARADTSVVPMIIHADQHGRLSPSNALFPYLSKAVPWKDISACIGLGDTVAGYSVSSFQKMEECLSVIPKDKQINIFGNHDTYYNTSLDNVLQEEQLTVLNTYFDNSAFNGHHKYSQYGIECMLDEERKIKYVTFGGWEYEAGKSWQNYIIGNDGMSYIIDMLTEVDGYDIVILTHITALNLNGNWLYPPVEDGNTQSGGGGISVGAGQVFANTSIAQMLVDRKNKASGTVKDSHGNVHNYDFTRCNSDLLCCFAGHEHSDKYGWSNNNILSYIFDGYAFDNHPFYFVNISRTDGYVNVWKIDDVTVYNYQIPLIKPTE